jgi:DNA repair ATPase RecN
MIKKEIANKLFKTKLSEQQKVELSLENDKSKFIQEAKAAFNKVDSAADKYRKAVEELKEAKKDVDNARKSLERITSQLGRAEKAFRDIGIDPPQYIYEVGGKRAGAWENDLIDYSQIISQYVR